MAVEALGREAPRVVIFSDVVGKSVDQDEAADPLGLGDGEVDGPRA
jgi:hypothetical protein